jgi:BetR domain
MLQEQSESGQLMNSISFQLIQAIRQMLPNKKDLAKTLSEILHLSNSAVYRKISGEVPFTLDETSVIMRHFRISVDNMILGGTESAGMRFRPLYDPVKSALDYYERALISLQRCAQIGNSPVLYVALTEIAPFHYLYFPELTAFRTVIWHFLGIRWSDIEYDTFKLETYAEQPQLKQISTDYLNWYVQIPSIEFISSNMLSNNLEALLHYSGQSIFIDPKTPLLICDQLEACVKHTFLMAKYGKKSKLGQEGTNLKSGAPITLFHDPMPAYIANVMIKSDTYSTVFTTLDYPNFLVSTSPNMTGYMEDWFERTKEHCFRISGEGEMMRNQLLQSMLKKIDLTRQQIRYKI